MASKKKSKAKSASDSEISGTATLELPAKPAAANCPAPGSENQGASSAAPASETQGDLSDLMTEEASQDADVSSDAPDSNTVPILEIGDTVLEDSPADIFQPTVQAWIQLDDELGVRASGVRLMKSTKSGSNASMNALASFAPMAPFDSFGEFIEALRTELPDARNARPIDELVERWNGLCEQMKYTVPGNTKHPNVDTAVSTVSRNPKSVLASVVSATVWLLSLFGVVLVLAMILQTSGAVPIGTKGNVAYEIAAFFGRVQKKALSLWGQRVLAMPARRFTSAPASVLAPRQAPRA